MREQTVAVKLMNYEILLNKLKKLNVLHINLGLVQNCSSVNKQI